MNLDRLHKAERLFLSRYPGGFADPELAVLGKKHKMEQMRALAADSFLKTRFRDPDTVTTNMVRVVSRASMVSVFEKPKFRDFVAGLDAAERRRLSNGLKAMLHGNQERGFNAMLDLLLSARLGKWSLMTIIPNYVHADAEVFCKPTTVKGVIEFFELEGLVYRPQPSWDFYRDYRTAILDMRQRVNPALAPNNAAFCGFLMNSFGADK